MDNINPILTIHKMPSKAKSLVLFLDDTQAADKCRTHWLLWNIEPEAKIMKRSVPGIQGRTDFRLRKYVGPFHTTGTHLFNFRLFCAQQIAKVRFPVGKAGT